MINDMISYDTAACEFEEVILSWIPLCRVIFRFSYDFNLLKVPYQALLFCVNNVILEIIMNRETRV